MGLKQNCKIIERVCTDDITPRIRESVLVLNVLRYLVSVLQNAQCVVRVQVLHNIAKSLNPTEIKG